MDGIHKSTPGSANPSRKMLSHMRTAHQRQAPRPSSRTRVALKCLDSKERCHSRIKNMNYGYKRVPTPSNASPNGQPRPIIKSSRTQAAGARAARQQQHQLCHSTHCSTTNCDPVSTTSRFILEGEPFHRASSDIVLSVPSLGEPSTSIPPIVTPMTQEMDAAAAAMLQQNLPATKWSQREVIGQGAFGKVYKGFDEEKGSYLAVKQIKLGNEYDDKMRQNIDKARRELNIMQSLDHPHIVQYFGAEIEKDPDTHEMSLFILQELMPQGSLQTALKGRNGGFWEIVVRRYIKQVLSGLAYLHENNIIHRDIKGANLLLNNMGVIKLADFGASWRINQDEEAKDVAGTPLWMAPEVIKGGGHGPAADIWSVGCTVIELATGKLPWGNLKPVQAMYAIASGNKSPAALPETFSPEAVAFVKRCMDRNQHARPTAKELLQDPWMTVDLSATTATPTSGQQ